MLSVVAIECISHENIALMICLSHENIAVVTCLSRENVAIVACHHVAQRGDAPALSAAASQNIDVAH